MPVPSLQEDLNLLENRTEHTYIIKDMCTFSMHAYTQLTHTCTCDKDWRQFRLLINTEVLVWKSWCFQENKSTNSYITSTSCKWNHKNLRDFSQVQSVNLFLLPTFQ